MKGPDLIRGIIYGLVVFGFLGAPQLRAQTLAYGSSYTLSSGTTTVAAGTTFSEFGTYTVTGTGTFSDLGTVTVGNGADAAMFVVSGGTVYIGSTAGGSVSELNLEPNSEILLSGGVINNNGQYLRNYGVVIVTGGTYTSSFSNPSAANMAIISLGNGTTAGFVVDGGFVNFTNNSPIGLSGEPGSMVVEAGTFNFMSQLFLYQNSSLTVTGTGYMASNGGTFVDDGTFTQTGGTVNTGVAWNVGDGSTGGVMTVSGGTFTNSGAFTEATGSTVTVSGTGVLANSGTTTVNSGATLTVSGGTFSEGATATVTVAGGQFSQTGGTLTEAAGGTFAVSGGTATFSGGTATLAGAVVVTGGTMNVATSVAGAGTYAVSGTGRLNLTANSALSAATAVSVSSGGSVIFGSGTTNAINTSANVTVGGGGSLVMKGASQTLGTLTLTTGTRPGTESVLNFSGGTNVLTINNLNQSSSAYFDILNWSGSSVTGSTSTEIVLGNTAQSFYASNGSDLGNVYWGNVTYNGTTYNNLFGATTETNGGVTQLIPLFNLVLVPEPSTVVMGLGLLALLAWSGARHRASHRQV